MAKGSLKLNMKRDDARTLMLKMDARLTYAGRERHASVKLEGERQLKHIEITHQLMNVEFNRARKDIQRRLEFYQTLKEQNKDRREKRDLAWCEEEEKEWDRQTRATRRRKVLPKLQAHCRNHKAEAVGSVRRDVKGKYTYKMSQEAHLHRSLMSLSDSYSKHKSQTERNQAKLERISEDPVGTPKTENPLPDKLERDACQPEIPHPKYGMPPLKSNLHPTAKTEISPGMPAGKVSGVPSNETRTGRPFAGPPAGLGQAFYMNTSTEREKHGAHTGVLTKDLPVLPGINRTRRKGVYAIDLKDPSGVGGAFAPGRTFPPAGRPSEEKKKSRPGPSLTLGPPQMVPLRFYGPEENPFLKGTDGPPSAVRRSKDLINSDKDDEMYEWLGFESREEFEKLRAAGLLLEAEREEGSETSDILEDDRPVASKAAEPDNTE